MSLSGCFVQFSSPGLGGCKILGRFVWRQNVTVDEVNPWTLPWMDVPWCRNVTRTFWIGRFITAPGSIIYIQPPIRKRNLAEKCRHTNTLVWFPVARQILVRADGSSWVTACSPPIGQNTRKECFLWLVEISSKNKEIGNYVTVMQTRKF